MKTKKLLTALTLLILFSFNLTAQVPPYVPTNSLIAWWPFTGNANDLSGNGNNGTVSNATLTSDRFGNSNSAYSFNGWQGALASSIQAPNQSLQGSVSFSGWYKMPYYTIPWGTTFLFANNSPTNAINQANFAVGYRRAPGPVTQTGHLTQCSDGTINTSSYFVTNQVLTANTWYHLVCVFNNGVSVKMYLNGNEFLNVNTTFSNTTLPSLPIVFGVTSNNTSFLGELDEIGIWNRVLTECEIKKLYNSPSFTTNANSQTICAGQSVNLAAGGVGSFTWSPGSFTANPVLSPNSSIIYTVSAEYTVGCVETRTIGVTVNPNPTITVNSGAICLGQSFSITPSGANTYTINQNVGNSYTIQGGSCVVSPTNNTSYFIFGTSAAGCVNRPGAWAVSNLTVNLNPTVFLSNEALCSGATFTLNAISPATGGDISYSDGYAIHTFTSNDTFNAPSGLNLEYLVIAGGGGGGMTTPGNSGGGGAGGFLTGTLNLPSSNYPIMIGNGGGPSINGENSSFYAITAIGGGFGGKYNGISGNTGGSGGGGGQKLSSGGAGISGQGNAGGYAIGPVGLGGAGGGGAGAPGNNNYGINQASGGFGGSGLVSAITGSNVYYAGGGGGSSENSSPILPLGGDGGGGNGHYGSIAATNGQANTGGGGGGGGEGFAAGNGGSGIIIIKYKQISVASYTWSNGANTSNIVISPSANTNYSVAITSTAGCRGSSNLATINISECTGLNEVRGRNLFSIYPNPTKGPTILKADVSLLGSFYSVYDNTGKLVSIGKISSESTVIEMNNLQGGIYLIRVGENLKQTLKVINE